MCVGVRLEIMPPLASALRHLDPTRGAFDEGREGGGHVRILTRRAGCFHTLRFEIGELRPDVLGPETKVVDGGAVTRTRWRCSFIDDEPDATELEGLGIPHLRVLTPEHVSKPFPHRNRIGG